MRCDPVSRYLLGPGLTPSWMTHLHQLVPLLISHCCDKNPKPGILYTRCFCPNACRNGDSSSAGCLHSPHRLDFSPAVSCPQLHGSEVISTPGPASTLDSWADLQKKGEGPGAPKGLCPMGSSLPSPDRAEQPLILMHFVSVSPGTSFPCL